VGIDGDLDFFPQETVASPCHLPQHARVGIGRAPAHAKLHVLWNADTLALEARSFLHRILSRRLRGWAQGVARLGSPQRVSLRFENQISAAASIFRRRRRSHQGQCPRNSCGSDLSEQFDIESSDSATSSPAWSFPSIRKTPACGPEQAAYDRRVAGIISGAEGVNPGMVMGQKGTHR